MIDARFRPMSIWPYESTPPDLRRSRRTFIAGWGSTLDLLEHELRALDAQNVVIGITMRERDIRQDGWPRADARSPSHPGIELSFDAVIAGRAQRLVYAVDSCEFWQHNIRSAALGLEALRAVDRYGISRTGQQYAGFKALPAGPSDGNAARGHELIAKAGSVRAALHAAHPDHGGTDRDFRDVQAAREAGSS